MDLRSGGAYKRGGKGGELETGTRRRGKSVVFASFRREQGRREGSALRRRDSRPPAGIPTQDLYFGEIPIHPPSGSRLLSPLFGRS